MSRYGASTFSSLLNSCVLWAPLNHAATANTGKTITANDGSIQSTAVTDPWGEARSVGYFGGYLHRLNIGPQSDMVFSDDFTIEFYVKCSVQPHLYPQIVFNRSTVDWVSGCFNIIVDDSRYPNGTIVVGHADYSGAFVLISTSTLSIDNNWHHIAVSRNGSTFRLFIDGQLDCYKTDFTQTVSFNIETWEIAGHARSNDAAYQGYLSEMRFSNIARYTANFTPSTTRFKPDINTNLLLHMDGSGATFVDDPLIDVDEFPIIPSGVTVTNSGTFTKTSLGNNKSVLKFDGSTNYISLSDDATWDFAENEDFTVSFWAKYITGPPYPSVVGNCPGTAATAGWLIGFGYELRFYFQATTGSSSWNICNVTSILSWTSGQWYHFAVVRKNGVITLYRDLTITASGAVTSAISSSNTLKIGYDGVQTHSFANGNIKDLMIYKGRALTQPEIKLLMNRTHPITGAGLLPGPYDYWRLTA